MEFSKRLDTLMEEKNIKDLKTLAKESNIPYTTMYDMYTGKTKAKNFKLGRLNQLSSYFSVSLDFITGNNKTSDLESKYALLNSNFTEDDFKFTLEFKKLTDEDKDVLKKLIERLKKN